MPIAFTAKGEQVNEGSSSELIVTIGDGKKQPIPGTNVVTASAEIHNEADGTQIGTAIDFKSTINASGVGTIKLAEAHNAIISINPRTKEETHIVTMAVVYDDGLGGQLTLTESFYYTVVNLKHKP